MHPRSLTLLAVVLLALGLAACGGDDETTTSSTVKVPTGATGTDTTGDVDTSGLPDPATLRKEFDRQLLQILTTTQGLSRSQAECAIKEFDSRISDEQIQEAVAEAAQSGHSPQDLIDQAFDAGAQCSKK